SFPASAPGYPQGLAPPRHPGNTGHYGLMMMARKKRAADAARKVERRGVAVQPLDRAGGSVRIVAPAHALGGLAHLACAVAHAARALLHAFGRVDQFLMGDMMAAPGLAGDDLLAIGAVAKARRLLLHPPGARFHPGRAALHPGR